MTIWAYLTPNDGVGFVRSLFAAGNLLFGAGAVILCAYLLLYAPRKTSLAGPRPTTPTKGHWFLALVIVASLVGLGYFTVAMPNVSHTAPGYTVYEVVQALVDLLDPILALRTLHQEPLNGFVGVNLVPRIMALYALWIVLRFLKRYIARLAARFSDYLEQRLEKLTQASLKARAKKAQPDTLEQSFDKLLRKVVGGIGVSVITYIFAPDNVQSTMSSILQAFLGFLQSITPLEQLQPVAGLSQYLFNVLVVLSSAVLLAIYIGAIALLLAFCVTVVKYWSGAVKKLNSPAGRKRLLRLLLILGLMALGITVAVVIIGLFQAGAFWGVTHYSPRELLSAVGHLALLGAAVCVMLACAALLLAFLVLSCCYIYHTSTAALASLFGSGSQKAHRHVRAAGLLRDLLDTLTGLWKLIPFALEHVCKTVKSALDTILQVFTGYRNELEKNQALFLAACFASLASWFNTFFGLNSFYNDDKELIPTLCAAFISFAVQLAMLIFGLKAGESMAERRAREGSLRQRFRRWQAEVKAEVAAMALPSGPKLLARLLRRWRAWRQVRLDNRKKACRVGFRQCLVAYLLLMLVSTIFAYTNMFGYYADHVELRQQVYDAVRYEAEQSLSLVATAQDIVDRYQENENGFLEAFVAQSDQTVTDRGRVSTLYTAQALAEASATPSFWPYRNRKIAYDAKTLALNNEISAIKSALAMDDEAFQGKDLEVTEYTQDVGTAETYQESYIEVGEIVHAGIDPANPPLSNAASPAPSPAPSFEPRKVTNINKYTVLKELVSQYVRTEGYVYAINNLENNRELKTIASQHQDSTAQLHSYLDQNARLSLLHQQVTQLYQQECRSTEAPALKELPHIAQAYLEGGSPSPAPEGYEELSGYLDRSIALYQVLSPFYRMPAPSVSPSAAPSASPSAPPSASPPAEASATPPAQVSDAPGSDYTARLLQNYAQSIQDGTFQISIEALTAWLFHPGQPQYEPLRAVTLVALFIFIICLLVDFMSFFSGWVLFKSVYLLKRNPKIDDVSYLNYEAVLIELLTSPKEGKEEQRLHLAFLYVLLHGDPLAAGTPVGPGQPLPTSHGLYELLLSAEFRAFLQEKYRILEDLGLLADGKPSPEFQTWATTFVHEREIDFSPLFP